MSDPLDQLQATHDRLARYQRNAEGCDFLQAAIDQARAQQDPLFREAAIIAAQGIAGALIAGRL